MIKAKELRIFKSMVLVLILLKCVSSHAQDHQSSMLRNSVFCSDPVVINAPPTIGMATKCKPIPTTPEPPEPPEPKIIVPESPIITEQKAQQTNVTSTETPESQEKDVTSSRTDSKVDISRQILRDTELVLNAKEKEFSIGLHYAKNDSKSDLRISRARVLTVPIDFNMGITNRLGFNASLPLLYYNRETITTAYSNDTSDSDIGNLTLGLSYNTRKETNTQPNVTTSISTSIPTKKSSSGNEQNDGLSSKFTGIRAGISVSKSISPAILFFNLGYKHYFSKSSSQSNLLPGDSISYGYGAGLSINSVLTFSGRVAGHYSKKSKRDGHYLLGTNSEPVNLNLSINYKLDKKKTLSYGIQFGINNDANDSAMSLSLVWGL